MIKPKVKLITMRQFATQENIDIKTAWSWLVRSNVLPYYIGETKRANKHGKWTCQIIALDESMIKAMKEMRVK